jgi:hypothetical protein
MKRFSKFLFANRQVSGNPNCDHPIIKVTELKQNINYIRQNGRPTDKQTDPMNFPMIGFSIAAVIMFFLKIAYPSEILP